MSAIGVFELIACVAILIIVALVVLVGVVALFVFLGRGRTPPAPQSGPLATKVCLSCGAQNPPDGVFCVRCRERLYEEIL